MLTLLKRIVAAFLYDEDWVTRWFIVALPSAGLVIATGGNIPGTEIVLPVGPIQWLGPILIVAGTALSSITSSLPQITPPAPPDPKP